MGVPKLRGPRYGEAPLDSRNKNGSKDAKIVVPMSCFGLYGL